MADVVGQAEEKERRLNKSRKKLERKLVGCLGLKALSISSYPPKSSAAYLYNLSGIARQTIAFRFMSCFRTLPTAFILCSTRPDVGFKGVKRSSPVCRPTLKVEARGEIEDLTIEHETEREELLDSIRNQNKELQLWEQVRSSDLPASRSQQESEILPLVFPMLTLAYY